MGKSLSKLFKLFLLLILLGAMAYGIKSGDFEETRVNGSALCLSCIGIQ